MINAKKVQYFSQYLHILYVEDDETVRVNMQMLFDIFFEHIDCAVDGLDGLEMYNNHKYDIVITDINMPRMNGVEMVEKIREIDPEQKIIAISANDDSATLINLIQKGVSGFLLKPVEQQIILNALYPICRDAHAQRENISLYEELNEERLKLQRKVKELEMSHHASSVKHQQLGEILSKDTNNIPSKFLEDYFTQDKDEGGENVVFMKEDADELIEIFADIPALMTNYVESSDMERLYEVIHSFKKVASILLRYTPFLDTLAESYTDLALVIETKLDACKFSSESMLLLLDAVSVDMERYVQYFSHHSMAMKNIHHVHQPTSLSIKQIIALLDPLEAEIGEIEFF